MKQRSVSGVRTSQNSTIDSGSWVEVGGTLKKKLAMRRKLLSGVIALRHTIDVTVLNWWMKTVMLIQYTCLWLTNPCIEARSSYKSLPGCSCKVRSMDAMWFHLTNDTKHIGCCGCENLWVQICNSIYWFKNSRSSLFCLPGRKQGQFQHIHSHRALTNPHWQQTAWISYHCHSYSLVHAIILRQDCQLITTLAESKSQRCRKYRFHWKESLTSHSKTHADQWFFFIPFRQ